MKAWGERVGALCEDLVPRLDHLSTVLGVPAADIAASVGVLKKDCACSGAPGPAAEMGVLVLGPPASCLLCLVACLHPRVRLGVGVCALACQLRLFVPRAPHVAVSSGRRAFGGKGGSTPGAARFLRPPPPLCVMV
jgi:hypothetical protein